MSASFVTYYSNAAKSQGGRELQAAVARCSASAVGHNVRRGGCSSGSCGEEGAHGEVPARMVADWDGGAGLFPAWEVASRLRCRCPRRTRAPGAALTGRTKHTAAGVPSSCGPSPGDVCLFLRQLNI
jgi:hypothetical protein